MLRKNYCFYFKARKVGAAFYLALCPTKWRLANQVRILMTVL